MSACKFNDTEKWCPLCRLWKEHALFGKNKNSASGLSTLCKDCKNSFDKKRDRRREVTGAPPQTEQTRDRKKAYRQKLRKSVVAFLGGRCQSPTCSTVNEDGTKGCTDERCLQVDHVYGDGSKERKELNISAFYLKVLADATGAYQLLCANCNWIKRYLNNEV